ncbi:MAG: caspase family protein [Rubrivivax sp.]|nr:caspase family protein [Rubrivivax sp.]
MSCRSVLLSLLCWAGATAAWAQADCAERFRIAFAGGGQACLTQYAVADESPAGHAAALRTVVPSSGYFALAATPGSASCPRALGFALTVGVTVASQGAHGYARDRQASALRDCNRAAGGPPEHCQCRLIVADGNSPLSSSEFSRFANTESAVANPAARPAAVAPPAAATAAAPLAVPASSGSSAPGTAAAPAPSAVPPAPTAAAAGATAGEVAALRQQVENLLTQVARAASATAAVPPPPAMARKAQRARALVIGNSRYAHLGALPNPGRDAEAMAAKLRGFGIEVDLHLDTDRAGLVRALTQFQGSAAGYDVNILFYAGHGLQIGGTNFFVPVDMKGDGVTAGSVKLNGVSLDDALEYLPAQTRVVFLDACRDNPIARSLRATRSAVGVGLAPVSTVSGTLLSYATRDGATAEDGNGRNSPYTTALLRHLDAEEDIALVLRRVRQSVLQMTSQRQEPWEYGSLIGEQLVIRRLAR